MTKSERREQKKWNRSKMKVSGRSVFTIQKAWGKRAENLSTKATPNLVKEGF